jgi:hypothetical protein
MSVEDFLARLQGVKKRGNNRWFALCPIHTEKSGSVSITERGDGKVLAMCFGCGATFPQICDAIGYQYRDKGWVQAENERNATVNRFDARSVTRALRDELLVAWVLLQDVGAGRVMAKDDRERAKVCARRCAAMIEELSQ